MKYLAVFFITAIAAITLVSSNAVHKGEERQSCDANRYIMTHQEYIKCGTTYATSCTGIRWDTCGCCNSTLASGTTGTRIYDCCGTFRDLVALEKACANEPLLVTSYTIRNCNLGGGAATTTVSYFTGLLLLLTAVTYQFLF